MADPKVKKAEGVFFAIAGSTDLKAGDFVYDDGSDWELADADVHTTFAEAIVCNNVSSGEAVALCTRCIIVDTDAPFTQGDQYYIKAPAGTAASENYTATRPTTAGNLRQLIGFGISTEELRAEVQMPKEHHVCYNFVSNVAAESGVELDAGAAGDFVAAFMNADDEDMGATFAIPQNAVALEYASIFTAAEVVTGATDFDVRVSGAADGEQHDAGTQDTTLANLVASGAVADEIQRNDAVTGFDAAGLFQPDNVIGVHMIYDGAQTDIVLGLCLEMVYLVV